MTSRPFLVAFVLATLFVVGAAVGPAGLGRAASQPLDSNPVTGTLTGPSNLALGANGTYYLTGTGGPGVVNGSLVGNLTFAASVGADNTTGVSVTPSNGSLTPNATTKLTLGVGNVTETVTLYVVITSKEGSTNASTNLSYAVNVRAPYTVRATLVAGSTAVQAFTVVVSLDGARVGNLTVPALAAGASYNLTYNYAGVAPGPGWHTFVLALPNEHGLVTFANGQTSFSTSFYVSAAAPNNSIWYVAGTVAFFGALFIFGSRVAARRRGAGRR